jgi:flap endonuclease-1
MEHGSLKKVVEHLRESSKNPPPEDWPWEEARSLFQKPEVTPSSELKLEWKKPDVEGLIEFLVKEKGFELSDFFSRLTDAKPPPLLNYNITFH